MKFNNAIKKAIENKANIKVGNEDSDEHWELTLDFILEEWKKETPYWETKDCKKSHAKELSSNKWKLWDFIE